MSDSNVLDLLKAVKDKKIKHLNRSIQAHTYFNNRAVALGENVKTAKKLGVTSQEYELRTTYYNMLDSYYHKSTIPFYKVTEKSVKFWRKVTVCQDNSGTDCYTYIKAQFWWFDKHFGTAPPIYSLVTENAIKRAMEFSGSRGNIVSSAIPHKSELSSVLQQTDKIIRAILKSQNLTKEEFYLKLVIPGEFPVAKAYLDIDPLYKKLTK
jgi:hypothetical protein